mmetsp:Transcript_22527/g.55763  ORF Transcript_22527/g.55763 Transcript_22527/m.55763 type:complete len:223 (-) Transcript_22527:58-726(-)
MFVYTSIGSFVKSSLCLHAVRPGPRRRLAREAILVSNLREAIRAAKLEVLRVCIARQPLLAQRASRAVRVRRGGVHAEHRTLVIRRQVHLLCLLPRAGAELGMRRRLLVAEVLRAQRGRRAIGPGPRRGAERRGGRRAQADLVALGAAHSERGGVAEPPRGQPGQTHAGGLVELLALVHELAPSVPAAELPRRRVFVLGQILRPHGLGPRAVLPRRRLRHLG